MTLDAAPSDSALLAMLARKRGTPVTLVTMDAPEPRRRASARAEGVSEHDIQVQLIAWADANTTKHPELACLFAVPNGGKRSIRTAVNLKLQGVKPGVPDLCLPVARGTDPRYIGLWIELKKPGGTTSPAQAHWLAALAMYGHKTALCTSWESARDHLLDYLTLPTTR